MATVKMTDDHFLCPVCLDFFKEPVMLECGHNFCKSCIDKTWDSQEIILCPECREEFPTKKYTINRLLRNLVETAERAQQCEEAGKPHQEQQTGCVVQSHECLEHKELLKVFCQEDGSPICLVCTMSSKHAGHKFQPLQEAVSMFQEKLKTAEAALKLRMNDLNKYQIQQQQLISGVKDKAQSFEQHIKSEFSALHQFLQDKEQQLIQKLNKETRRIIFKMGVNLMKIEKKSEIIQRQISAIQSKLQQEDPLHFLTDKLEIAETCLEVKMDYLNERQIKQEEYISGIQKKEQNLEQHIKSEFAKQHKFLEGKEQQLIQQLKDETTTIIGKMKENLQKIEEKTEAIQGQISNIQLKLHQKNPFLLLLGVKDDIERYMKGQEKEDIANVELVSEDLTAGKYTDHLQYTVSNGKSVINPGYRRFRYGKSSRTHRRPSVTPNDVEKDKTEEPDEVSTAND